jgi:hypothetical protein
MLVCGLLCVSCARDGEEHWATPPARSDPPSVEIRFSRTVSAAERKRVEAMVPATIKRKQQKRKRDRARKQAADRRNAASEKRRLEKRESGRPADAP